MSDPRLISPLLDNFVMGDPISEHSGIRCCPAMDTGSENKYFVKIISVPASETQHQALLLTGALENEEAADSYYQNRAKEISAEIELLQTLSRHEGFLSFEGHQTVSFDEGTGYDVYILAKYKRSLERQFQKKPLTHLDALNLGLDLCSALAACRRNGYLFVNLKPSNIFVTENNEYKICDLGFISLSNLKYATLEQHYISEYTPAEQKDPFSPLNTTIDVYGLGMILYQIYNGGILPNISSETLPAPAYADEELSEIILKACAINPDDRWQDPAQMGQMLVNYMQKNGASDLPIVPPAPEIIEPEEAEPEEITPEDIEAEALTDEEVETENEETHSDEMQEAILTESAPESVMDASAIIPENSSDIPVANDDEAEALAENVITEEPEQLSIDAITEEISAEDDLDDISYEELSDEVVQMLSQADELAAMDVPEPVVAPEAIEVSLPAEEEPEPEQEEIQEQTEESENDSEDVVETDYAYINEDQAQLPPRKNWLAILLWNILGVCIILGGFLFYKFYVLKTVDELQVIGNRDTLTVTVSSDADEGLLSISCTDVYGKTVIVPATKGEAEFSGLLANAEYSVEVLIDGFHVLGGKTTASYFTPPETTIVQYSVVTGNIPGSVIISFTISGPDSEQWSFTYSENGQNEQTVTFTGHTLTLTDLDQNAQYTGTLSPVDDLFISEITPIDFVASDVILANDLMITSCQDNKLTAEWSAPEGVTVENWSVRCYNGTDYDQTINTSKTYVEFTGLDHTDSFTVDVTAVGQSYIQTASVGENSITVTDLTVNNATPGMLSLSWNSEAAPDGGWIVSYTIDDSQTVMSAACEGNAIDIVPAVPDAKYTFTVRAADSTPTICKNIRCYTAPADDFSVNFAGNLVTKDNLFFYLCKRPASTDWSYLDLTESDYTSTFSVGQSASYVIYINRMYDLSYDDMITAFVIRNDQNEVVCASSVTKTWTDMWYRNYCELDIPTIPDVPGNYTISVYFDGQFAVTQELNIVE